ncbi:hypothetical protein H072_7877 [Dactylellina haptotyla CBS 200.50]|uniref:Uncharacterized protein n=1 Tax=Dactylellina haptotyla (strain CBS 200.50) TaxID=1284197 RepID=S8BT67_DACHA|nr:hypothetical protein H072_7877 [Dactylellina haptotyla CBS 200.50]
MADASQVHADVESLVEKFDVLGRIDAIEKADEPVVVPVTFVVETDVTIELDAEKSKFSSSTKAPSSVSKGETEFTVTQGDELKYNVTAGDVKGDFKIKFDIDDSAPKLKLGDELEDGDKTGLGFETTKVTKKVEIELKSEVETKKEWNKGKKIEKKSTKEREHEGKAGGYEYEFKEQVKYKQEKDEFEYQVEKETEIEAKSVKITWRIY